MLENGTISGCYHRISGERNYSLGGTEMIHTIMPPVRIVQPNFHINILYNFYDDSTTKTLTHYVIEFNNF